MTARTDVVVVGGGLAGLAAGASVRAAGRTAVVLDTRAPGGRARVAERGGYVFNMGAHALYAGGPGMRVLRGLGVQPAGSPPPLSDYQAMDAAGRLHTLPVGPTSLLRTTALSARSKAKLAKVLGLLARIDARALAGESVAEWIGGLDLQPDGARAVRALVQLGTYADDLGTMSADAGITQLQLGAKAGVLYLDGGWAQLIDGLAAQVEVRRSRVAAVEPGPSGIEVRTDDGVLVAGAVIVAAGTPDAARALLPADPGWTDPGPAVTAACLDVGVTRVPGPGYVLGLDEPVYATTQSPPARQAPPGCAVVSVLRYGATEPAADEATMQRFLRAAGVRDEDIAERRFMARSVVTGAAPLAANGGLAGRPAVDGSGVDGVLLAGDWVGPDGLLADAALASGHAAARAAVRWVERTTTMVV